MPPKALTDPAARPIDGLAAPYPAAHAGGEPGRPFAGVMQVSQSHSQARAQLQSFRSGQTDLRWEEVAQSLQQVQSSLQEMMQLRRQLVSAYTGLQDGVGAGQEGA